MPQEASGSALVLAIADGHGSKESHRSGVGSELAVRAATSVLFDFLQSPTVAEQQIGRDITERWRASVAQHASDHPLPNASDEGWIAYGTTILAALATPDFVLYLQLGDGDILIVSEDGQVRRPWPRDERFLANETTSLCSSNASEEIRIGIDTDSGSSPQLIVLSSDGYSNSFRREEDFLRTGPDFLDIIRTQGFDAVHENLQGWLSEASRLGSGDDITVGLICRENRQACAGQATA